VTVSAFDAAFSAAFGNELPPPTGTSPAAGYIFTPPADVEKTGPIPAWAVKSTKPEFRLLAFFQPYPRGVNVYKMSDGSYRRDDLEVIWPATDAVPNDVIASSWGLGSIGPQFVPIDNPVVFVYYSAHGYPVDQAEADALTAAGYGPYITVAAP
jgi:hypothetical protein